MNFFIDPAFFVLLVPIVAVAAALGVAEKPIAGWAGVAGAAMLLLMFGRQPASLAFFLAYLAGSLALAKLVVRLFAGEAAHPHAVALYRVALAAQIAPLVVYKVGVLFDPDFLGFLGISYITFKAVQVLIETRDGLIKEVRTLPYLYFLSFFPTFTSGPILRSRAFMADVSRTLPRDEYLERLYRGLGWFCLGALYKFVAAPLAQWLMWFGPSAIGTRDALAFAATQCVYGFAFGLDLFFDFAGYSAMAMGLGLALGVEVPRNFRAPFASIDIKEFWDRWHITLSHWLRDFVFMRFSRTAIQHKLFKSSLTTACVGFILNMTLMGFWHGITLPYIAYGVYHGVLIALCEVMQKKWKGYRQVRKKRWFMCVSWAVTMVAVFFGFALFSGQVFSPVGA